MAEADNFTSAPAALARNVADAFGVANFRTADGPGRMGTRNVPTAELTECNWLMPQLRVFRFRLLKNRDVEVGVLPNCQEILVRSPSLLCVARYAKALASCKCANAPTGSAMTMPDDR